MQIIMYAMDKVSKNILNNADDFVVITDQATYYNLLQSLEKLQQKNKELMLEKNELMRENKVLKNKNTEFQNIETETKLEQFNSKIYADKYEDMYAKNQNLLKILLVISRYFFNIQKLNDDDLPSVIDEIKQMLKMTDSDAYKEIENLHEFKSDIIINNKIIQQIKSKQKNIVEKILAINEPSIHQKIALEILLKINENNHIIDDLDILQYITDIIRNGENIRTILHMQKYIETKNLNINIDYSGLIFILQTQFINNISNIGQNTNQQHIYKIIQQINEQNHIIEDWDIINMMCGYNDFNLFLQNLQQYVKNKNLIINSF